MPRQGRRINGWEDFNGIVFWARIGVEKDKTGHYEDKNKNYLRDYPGYEANMAR